MTMKKLITFLTMNYYKNCCTIFAPFYSYKHYFLGPFQPSYDMMLRFYSYFKQATEGPCRSRRPAFWDMVGKVKYDTWKRLGDMPREKAMEAYVEELRQIVETMSYTQNVAEFYNSLNQFDMKIEDIELIAPDLIRNKSQENSPHHKNEIQAIEDIPNKQNYSNSTEETSDDDDDEYIDTVDVRNIIKIAMDIKIILIFF